MLYFLTLWAMLGAVGFLFSDIPSFEDPKFNAKMKVLGFLSGPIVWAVVFLFCAIDWITTTPSNNE